MEALTLHDSAKHKAQLVDPHHVPNPAHSQFEQNLHLDRPAVGDIKRHFKEVQNLATAQPRKGLYYRLWLCWMYRMEWAKIEHTVQHAPNYIIQVVNYWFGLRNHPFWTASDKCPYQWYAMYGACLDIWKWWDRQNTEVGDDSDGTITQESSRGSAISRSYRVYVPPSTSQVETRYPTFHGRVDGRDSIQPDSSITPPPGDHIFTTPWQISGDLSLMLRTYKSFCSPDKTMQAAIPFQTWIYWIHQVNLRPSAKHWAGHDLWPSNSTSTTSLNTHLPCQAVSLESVGDIAFEYVKDIGLPYKAAAYYQSVSYM